MIYRLWRVLITVRNLLLFFMFVVLLFAGCGGNSDEGVSQPPAGVEQAVRQFSLTHSRDGRMKWTLNADSATFLESDRIALQKVKLLIYGDKDGETATINGDNGELNERTYDVKIMGNVEGISSDGGRLNTEELYWRDRTGKIYTESGVKVTITNEDSVVVGERLLADPELETVKLRSMTGVTTRVEEEVSEKSAD